MFHEAFWAVVGGAAPVIALAAVVSIGDLYDQSAHRLKRDPDLLVLVDPGREAPDGRWDKPDIFALAGKLVHLLLRLLWVQTANVVMQAGVLGLALVALAEQTNVVPASIAIAGEVGGVAVHAYVALGLQRVKALADLIHDRIGQWRDAVDTEHEPDSE